MNIVISECESKMKKGVDSFRKELTKIRGGSVSKGMFDDIKVDYYGAPVPLNQVCNINMSEDSTVMISPYDENALDDIVKGIQKSDLGFNPSVDKNVIIINIPPLTQERRTELVKFLNKQTEAYRVSLRNIRKDSNEGIKKLFKSKDITEDESKGGQSQIQELTDKYISIINLESSNKEQEITKI
ncbi:ribosome recycling factor [bacterium]|jgi:ribosome recycling factor|nr:ribosome recycling factor [bacterium]MBT3795548.1 ribosome recycling factor [bacterium]MBT4634522.1 ribosome recycling factor [bacterium]